MIALSSGEAELYALVKAASQGTGLLSMLMDFGHELEAKVYTDSTAALGIVHRRGLGKTRHISTQYLWIQEKVGRKEISVGKVGTNENPADLLTKHLKFETVLKHVQAMGGVLKEKRDDNALKLQLLADAWCRESPQWTRIHTKPRISLFTPMKVARGPTAGSEVGEWRTTEGVYQDGTTFLVKDRWKAAADPHAHLAQPWTGITTFTHTKEHF